MLACFIFPGLPKVLELRVHDTVRHVPAGGCTVGGVVFPHVCCGVSLLQQCAAQRH